MILRLVYVRSIARFICCQKIVEISVVLNNDLDRGRKGVHCAQVQEAHMKMSVIHGRYTYEKEHNLNRWVEPTKMNVTQEEMPTKK